MPQAEPGQQEPFGPSVFVSYSREDLKAAKSIISAIEAAGYPVWWDGMLAPGERFANTTETALESARAVVVLWSAKSISSHWVHDEATRGRDRSCLVPLSIDGTKPPLGFRQFQTYRVTGKRGDPGIAAMLQALGTLHDAPLQKPVTVLQAPTANRRAALLGSSLALAGVVAGTAWWAGLIGTGAARGNSVAVMPFKNVNQDQEGTYFADGLAAEVRAQLASEPLLIVAAQTSSAKLRDSRDPGDVSRQLNVAYLLEGSVRRDANSVRVSAELIEGQSGTIKWALKPFNRPLENVFAVQEEIANQVMVELTRQMAAQGVKGSAKELGGTISFAAYDAYLRGRSQFDNANDRDSDQLALHSFEKAIALDPDYAMAHAARSRSLTVFGDQYDQGQARVARYGEAVAAALKAVRLAPDLADAQASLGFARFNGQLDARGAQQPYQLSYDLGRGSADVLTRFGQFEARCGRIDSARQALATAARLDPLNARVFRLIGEVEFCAGNWDAVDQPVSQALKLNPAMSVAHATLAAAQIMQGKFPGASASAALEKSSLFRLPLLAILALRQHKPEEAERHLAALLAEHGDNSLYQRAQVMAQWDRKDEALNLLEAGYKAIDAGLIQLRNDPFLEPLRKEPRLNELRKKIGFE